MMKVAIIAFNNMKYSPYVKTYSGFFDKNNIEYNIIYPKREQIEDNLVGEHYPIKWDPKKKKVWNFLKFRKEAIKILKKNKYDFAVVLTTFPAVLLSGFLSRHYKGRYLVDIRDYTHEGNRIYFHCEKKALMNAKLRVISSPGFKKFLPDHEYLLCHNMPSDYTEPRSEFKRSEGRIIIGYVGTVTYASQCKKLIDLVKNDDRFCFYFYGNENGAKPVTTYVNELQNERIKCFGAYNASEKAEIVESVDILFNVYGNQSQLVKCAVSNKLYDSFYFKKPLLTSSETIMSEIAKEFSFDLDKCSENLDKIYSWYNEIDEGAMVEYMNGKFTEYRVDMDNFEKALDSIIR